NHRVTKACSRCRHRKARCDLKYPTCGGCASAKVPCVGYDSVQRRERPRSTVAHLEDKVAALEIELSRLKSEERVDSSGLVKTSITSLTETLASTIAGEPVSRTQHSLATTTKTRLTEFHSPLHLSPSPLPLFNDDEAPQELSEQTKSFSTISLIPRQVVDIMLSNYTEIYLPQSPYIEVSQLHSACERIFSDDSRSATSFDVFIVATALAISSTTLMRHDEERATAAALEFWNTAREKLAQIPQDQPCNQLQALLLVTHYGFVNPEAVNVWATSGAAFRLALKMGLHRELPATEQEILDQSTLDLRRKLFWAAYTVDAAVHFVIGKAFTFPRSAVTAQYPVSIFGDTAAAAPEASPVIHTWPLRQLEAESSRVISKIGPHCSTKLSIPVELWRTQAIQRIESWYALTHTSSDGRLGEKIEFRDIMYHTNLFRFNCPSPQFPEPSVEMRKRCLHSIIALASIYTRTSRVGKLFYIWHAAHQLFECGVCLVETVLESVRSSSCGGPSVISDFDGSVLAKTVRTIPRLLQKISHRWSPVGRHAKFLEDCSPPVLDCLEYWARG
ncbi:hypothetical protein K490DRAFT_5089, partial [Saccharata proteae CBS 121410]